MGVSTPRPVRNAEYYLQEQSKTAPAFLGKGAEKLGLTEFTAEKHLELFAGRHDGVQLPRYMHKDRRGAMDVTVNMPKCASVLNEIAGDSRIGEVLERSARAVFDYIEKEAKTRCPWEQPGKLIGSVFVHPGSREGDAHSHAHLCIYNMADTSKGYKAIELGRIDWKEVTKINTETQMKGLRELGYKVKREGPEYSIVGVPAEVKAKFSRRHESIQQTREGLEARIGKPMSSRAKNKLSVYERPEKPHSLDVSQLTDSEHRQLGQVVAKAKATGKLDRLHETLQRHSARLRAMEVTQDAPQRERSHGRGR